MTRAGRGGLGRPFQLALAGWGLPLALIAVWPDTVVAVVCLAFSGFANSLLDVSGFTSMQEHTDDHGQRPGDETEVEPNCAHEGDHHAIAQRTGDEGDGDSLHAREGTLRWRGNPEGKL